MSPDEREVVEANASFYAAFARRDADAMDALWAREAPVACLHPGWEPLLGCITTPRRSGPPSVPPPGFRN